MENNFFKGTLFGGFRREDVIAYIERTANESKELIAGLEQRNGKLSKENETLRADLDAAVSQRDRLSEELRDNGGKQESLSKELSTAREELGELRAQLATLTSERDSLRAEVEMLRPQLENARSLKEKVADLELAAQRRAEEYETETRRRADEYDTETRRRADAYESQARLLADEYDTATRRRADEYETEANTRLRGIVESCRTECVQALQSLLDGLDGLLPGQVRAGEAEDEE